MPSVMLTGASGLLGRAIMKVLEESKWKTIGIAHSRVKPGLVKCDIRDKEAIKALIEKERPEYIIHAAAERAPDAVENRYEETCVLNVKASGDLAELAKTYESKIIYISTDYVFDGKAPPYKSTDTCNPLNKYGISKWEGEKAVLAANPGACILRAPILYGHVERVGESAVTCLLDVLRSPEQQYVSHYEKRYPCFTRDFACILRDLIKVIMKDSSTCGIFQWCGKQRMTKYDMIVVMSQVFSLPLDNIIADSKGVPGALRPYDAELDRSRLEDLGISHHTDFAVAIKECLQKWV